MCSRSLGRLDHDHDIKVEISQFKKAFIMCSFRVIRWKLCVM